MLQKTDVPVGCSDLQASPDRECPDAYDFKNCRTRLDRLGPYFLPDVIAAILVTEGNFADMALLLGRRRNGVREFVQSKRAALDVLEEVRECHLDGVEKNHNALADLQDGPALRFILSTLGKDRGYTTRVEQTGKDGGPVRVLTLDVSKLSTEQLKAIRNATIPREDEDPPNGSVEADRG